ncbi:MAG: M15 family metallopeptidase [Erysipelotrichaceae bacterium]|nr:M15 family metallopeptidase [Erysipelotrichaceae bacterium]
MDKNVQTKLIIVIILAIFILLGLLYMFIDSKISDNPKPTPTMEPTIEPTIIPTEEPEPTPTIEVIVDIDSDNSINKLANKEKLISDTYVPELVQVEGTDKKLRPEAADAYLEMVEAAKNENINIILISGYRSYSEQRSLWYTYEEKYGRKYANRMDATPGASEHQLGLAVDLGGADGKCKLYECFENTSTGKWLFENAYKYGYILRYPKGKESVTGIMYSPWHYRYIGKEEAQKVFDSNLTLEEFYQDK